MWPWRPSTSGRADPNKRPPIKRGSPEVAARGGRRMAAPLSAPLKWFVGPIRVKLRGGTGWGELLLAGTPAGD